MGTYASRPGLSLGLARGSAAAVHGRWLAAGLALGFLVPYVLADVLGLQRDVYVGLYSAFALGLFAAWARSTGRSLPALVRRRLVPALVLGAACAGVLALVVVRTEDATARPDGLALAGAVLWRGVVYGVADGVLLSAFPILVVFAALGAPGSRRAVGRTLAVGLAALVASLAMTAAYHAGYGDFRSEKLRSPVAGDLVWSAPTLATLNPLGAPVAHVGLHVAAVVHSSETDLFLPPHA